MPMHNPEQGIRESKPTVAPPAPENAVSATPSAAASPSSPRTSPRPAPGKSRWKVSEAILVSLFLILAFFLASFAVTNADFWMHLATGRLIAQGEYVPGDEDPFSFMSEPGPWINHSWLYDWGLYTLYELIGGQALVVLKGLVAVALILVLFQLRRREFGWGLPVGALALSALAMSPRLFFSPMLLSLLALAITLALLFKKQTSLFASSPAGPTGQPEATSVASGHTGWRHLWWLPVLFALWVNLDSWFILGPITVAVFLLGMLVQRRAGNDVGPPPRLLAGVLGVGLLACLVNPYHVRAFQLPGELAYPLAQAGDAVHIPLPDVLVASGR